MRYCMGDAEKLQSRLKKAIGQLNGVYKMIGEDIPCDKILVQLNAANGALHRISLMILEGHLRHCVRDGIEHGDADKTIEQFAAALENFAKIS